MKIEKVNLSLPNEDGKYYIGVAEETFLHRATWIEAKAAFGPNLTKNMSSLEPSRFFSGKFFKDPLKALLSVCLEEPIDWYDKEMVNNFLKSVYFDPRKKVYIYNRFSTTGSGYLPKDDNYKKFFSGEYTLNICHVEAQLLSTNVETCDLGQLKLDGCKLKTWRDFKK